MATAFHIEPPVDTSDDLFMSDMEAIEIFDLAARRYVGMDGAEFVAAWDRGDFLPHPDSIPGVSRVAILLPLVQR